MRIPPWLVSLVATVPVLGCSAADFVNWTASRQGYSLQRDLAYAPGPRSTLDLYVPDHIRPNSPAVVFIYGGNWDSGDKETYLFVGQALASRGYLTAIPDYRVYPEVQFPGFVEDAAKAVAWMARQSPAAGPRRPVMLVGHSAGAQIAMLLARDEHYLADAGVRVCDTVAAAVGMAGPYDFLPLKEERYRSPEATRAASQPIAFADGTAPPVLLLVGDADRTVDPGNTARLAARIADGGGRVTTRVYSGISHVGLVGAFARPFRRRASVLEDIDRFVSALEMHRPFC